MKFDPLKLYKAIVSISPTAQYTCDGDCYEGLTWYNDEYKPTEEEIVQKISELTYQEEVESYKKERAAEYPSYADQFDKIFHEGVDAWKADIQLIKDKHPKQTMDADTLQTKQNEAISGLQSERYIKATERLSQYVLLEGREEITQEVVIDQEMVLDEEGSPTFDDDGNPVMRDITKTEITQTAIEPLEEFIEVTNYNMETEESTTESVRNPLVVKDEEERAAAQAVVDATPQAVIDTINT